MLDIELIRKNPNLVKENLKKHFKENLIELVDKILEIDNKWRSIIKELNNLRKERNKISREYAKTKNENLLKKANELKEKIEKLETEEKKLKEERDELLKHLPNILHEDVPIGKDESENVPIRYFGKVKVAKDKIEEFKKEFGNLEFEIVEKTYNHYELMEGKVINSFKAAQVSTSRFYYMFDKVVKLWLALIHYGLDFLEKRNYKIVYVPDMLRRQIEESATHFSDFEEMIYKIENEDLYLIPTAEHAILALHFNEIIEEEKLPLKYAGISVCFRKEAGAHGKDTKGIFRVHQFDKVEQFIFSKPEESWKMFEELIKNAEEFYQSLNIPYRVVNICSGEIGYVAAKKYDLEAWFPGQNKFREIVSCSNCTDWQARRANIRLRRKDGSIEFVHTLNSTLVAVQRTICAIFENFYDEKSKCIVIPKPLVKYTEFEFIEL